MRHVVFVGLPALLAQPAASCPVCRTGTGEAVRSGIFNSDFGFNLFVTILPFLVFYAVAVLVYVGSPKALFARMQRRSGMTAADVEARR